MYVFEDYGDIYEEQVAFLEDPEFLSEWYGIMYYSNESEVTFRL